MIRPYIDDKTHARVLKYAASMGIKPHSSGIGEMYQQLINTMLDENGNVKERVVLTVGQEKIIQDIAAGLGQSPDKVVQDMINYAMLIYTTHISLREVIVAAAPHILDSVVNTNPEIAKEILQGLKGVAPKPVVNPKPAPQTSEKLNPAAALRYSEDVGL